MKSVAGKTKVEHAQYRELKAFAQFGTSDLDAATRRQLERGARIDEIFKQPQYQPVKLAYEVTILYAINNGFLNDVPVDKIQQAELDLRQFMDTTYPNVVSDIAEQKVISPEIDEALKKALGEFNQMHTYTS
jgi:F-type H+-transporting ATPase subunit alpha